MRRIIDLTHPIQPGMLVYPGDPPVKFRLVQSINETGYNVSEICIGSHTGTHVDVPRHCLRSDSAVNNLPLDMLVGWAEVLDLTGKSAGSEITSADLDAFADRVSPGARLLLRTDWSKRYGQPDFFENYPALTEGAALWITKRKVKLVAIEQPSAHPVHDLEVHKALLSEGVILIEMIANLDALSQDRVYITALPLNFVGMDGSPLRVVAIEGDEA